MARSNIVFGWISPLLNVVHDGSREKKDRGIVSIVRMFL